MDHDGTITYEEFKVMLENHGIYTNQNDMVTLFKQFDKGQTGKIHYVILFLFNINYMDLFSNLINF